MDDGVSHVGYDSVQNQKHEQNFESGYIAGAESQKRHKSAVISPETGAARIRCRNECLSEIKLILIRCARRCSPETSKLLQM